jgi:Tfp pilus assembly protein PilZ
MISKHINEKTENDAKVRVWTDGKFDVHRERRVCERFSSNLQARLFYGNLIYTGKVTNISMSGMFISTKVKFPVNSEFLMVVLLDDRTVKIPIKVKRTIKQEDDYYSELSGLGVELLQAPRNYLDYVGSCKPI